MIKYKCGGNMKFFADVGEFLRSLSFVDIVFFFAILVLMILVVTLIYFIKINKDNNMDILEEIMEEPKKEEIKQEEIKPNLEETAEMKIVKEIADAAKLEPEVKIDPITEYEKDQEDKAIISYDELLNKNNNYELNYEKEEVHDDLVVKKVNLDNIVGKNVQTVPTYEARVISFQKEEAFLEALKKLQQELG